jgi:hypothetical protein
MRAIGRDLIRGGHYGQRSCEPHSQGRTHGCTDHAAYVKKILANLEPSTHLADLVLNTTMSASDPKRFIGVSDATPMYNLRHDDCS